MVVNVPAHTYNVYVTPQGRMEITLASNYAFRTEQATVTSLANVAEIGDAPAPVRSFSILPAPDTTPPTVPLNLAGTAVSSSRINLAWIASTDNVAVTGYKIYRNGLKVGTSAITSYSDTGLSGSTAYNYTVSAYDATGNNSAPSSPGISVKTLPVVITSGCGKTVSAGFHATTIIVNGTSRIPTGYNPNVAIPLTFHFHGAGANGLAMYNGGMDADAAAAGNKMISIYPNGLKYGGTTGWDLSKTGVDVALFDALLSRAESNFCIDLQTVFVAGFSWGHDFANTLTCYRGDKIRAVNGWSGGMYNTGCVASVPAYRATYSSPDGTDAYSQAEINHAINYYKTAHHCLSVTQPVSPSPCMSFQGCAKPVNFCPYLNMDRVPPGGWVATWDFFKSFISSPP
jgi:poly(3-hydroxybutyrate) depolymerase